MELVVFLIFAYGVYHAWKDSKAAWRRSRAAYTANAQQRFPNAPRSRRAAAAIRHDVGYWAAQLLHAFPATRHGFAAGWHRGRAAQASARAAREEAVTQRLENRADLAENQSGFRARQQEALRRWQTAMDNDRERTTEGTVTEEGNPGSGPAGTGGPRRYQPRPGESPWRRTGAGDEPQEGSAGSREGSRQPPGDPPGDDADQPAGPTGATPGDTPDSDPATEDRPPWSPPRRADAAADGDPTTEPDTQPEQAAAAQGTPTQGDQNMASGSADVTYDGVLQSMTEEKAAAEQRAAEQQQASKDASAMADNMQSLEVDPATLGAVADHLDAHEEAVKALQRVRESAENVEAALKRGHAGLAEAHQSAPVQAADRDFYAA